MSQTSPSEHFRLSDRNTRPSPHSADLDCRPRIEFLVGTVVAVMPKLALSLWYIARGDGFDSRNLFNVRSLGMVR